MTRRQSLPADRQERMLGEARTALFSFSDSEANLAQVARLAIPALADGCVIPLRDRDGRMRLLTALHSDADRLAALETLHRREALGVASEEGPYGPPEPLRHPARPPPAHPPRHRNRHRRHPPKSQKPLAEEIAIRCGMRVEARKKRVFGVSRGFSILSPEPGP